MSVLARVDPEYLPVINMVPLIDLNDIAAARAALQAVFAMAGRAEPHPEVDRTDLAIPNAPGAPEAQIRVFRPRNAAGILPGLVWIQGGGYVLTSANPDDQGCEQIAHELQCVVASVLWRRAPEHPFPAAHDDCFAALLWMIGNAGSLGIDADRIVVGGASSGGGAAAGVALRARNEGLRLRHQLLVYPMLDDRNVIYLCCRPGARRFAARGDALPP